VVSFVRKMAFLSFFFNNFFPKNHTKKKEGDLVGATRGVGVGANTGRVTFLFFVFCFWILPSLF